MRPLWQFVAPGMLLNKHNAFVRRNVCGVDVAVQNFNGESWAFDNLCPYPIQQQPQGVRPLVCGYYGWGYASKGAVHNIPLHGETFSFCVPARGRECLRRFAIAHIGSLGFVNLAENPIPIKEQCSPAAREMLCAVSEQFDDEVLVVRFETHFNWKLTYESHRPRLQSRVQQSRRCGNSCWKWRPHHIRSSAWISDEVQVGNNARIGNNAIWGS